MARGVMRLARSGPERPKRAAAGWGRQRKPPSGQWSRVGKGKFHVCWRALGTPWGLLGDPGPGGLGPGDLPHMMSAATAEAPITCDRLTDAADVASSHLNNSFPHPQTGTLPHRLISQYLCLAL